jgi:hypothetical protein
VLEADGAWLARLRSLNTVIAASGEPLVGNLFYAHLQADFVTSNPIDILRRKRERFRRAVIGRTRLLEVGVNGGHSAYLALTANPTLEFHGVDICEHAYVEPAVAWLQAEFPDRVFFHAGDCLTVLPRLADTGRRFDCFHIDGAKHTYYEDILNCLRMMRADGAVVVVDDTHLASVARIWRRCVRQGLIDTLADFPAMVPAETFRHQVGTLHPIPPSKRAILLVYARALTRLWQARLALGRLRRRLCSSR